MSAAASFRAAPAAHDKIFSPGARMSGFMRPSPVGPFDEKYETPYVCGASRCVAPTVIASSALPGSLMVLERPTLVGRTAAATVPKPVFPAAATTTTPDCTRRFTSAQIGLWPQ